jgi:hypothetical protein
MGFVIVLAHLNAFMGGAGRSGVSIVMVLLPFTLPTWCLLSFGREPMLSLAAGLQPPFCARITRRMWL